MDKTKTYTAQAYIENVQRELRQAKHRLEWHQPNVRLTVVNRSGKTLYVSKEPSREVTVTVNATGFSPQPPNDTVDLFTFVREEQEAGRLESWEKPEEVLIATDERPLLGSGDGGEVYIPEPVTSNTAPNGRCRIADHNAEWEQKTEREEVEKIEKKEQKALKREEKAYKREYFWNTFADTVTGALNSVGDGIAWGLREFGDKDETWLEKFQRDNIGGGALNLVGAALQSLQATLLNGLNALDSVIVGETPKEIYRMDFHDYCAERARKHNEKNLFDDVDKLKESGWLGSIAGNTIDIVAETLTDPLSWIFAAKSVKMRNANPIEKMPKQQPYKTTAGGTGNRLPNVDKVIVDSRKVTDYALNPKNLSGGADKARVFESALGYNQSNANQLIAQIQGNLSNSEAVLGVLDQYGQRFTVDILITGPNGNTAIVRTGWISELGSDIPRMTTLFVK